MHRQSEAVVQNNRWATISNCIPATWPVSATNQLTTVWCNVAAKINLVLAIFNYLSYYNFSTKKKGGQKLQSPLCRILHLKNQQNKKKNPPD